jgi:UDP-N-acetylglucosamine 1-carboxyvinyltransferase
MEPLKPQANRDERFLIRGGTPLRGRLRVCGAKNAAVAFMAAALLTEDEVIIEDVPRIGDVAIMAAVLRSLGATVEWAGEHTLRLKAEHIATFEVPGELVELNRASFLVMGPLLGRFGKAISPPPGGDVIGQRPVDVHLAGFAALGAEVHQEGNLYVAEAERLRGAPVFMDYPSHTGTENLLMAASLAEGRTIIRNASQEPEIVALGEMLTQMGATISGVGTSTIVVEGAKRLRGGRFRLIPDRIEAGTFAIAAALTQGEVALENVCCAHMESLLWKLEHTGVEVVGDDSCLVIRPREPLQATIVQALPYPGFPTDLQATFGVLMTQAFGVSVIHERVYENRLRYFQELRKMGAKVVVRGQVSQVWGPTPLRGTTVRALDIRAGAALTLAGLIASGRTVVKDVYHLDRGYERFDERLRALGAHIDRIT